jgi:hypothetical protein
LDQTVTRRVSGASLRHGRNFRVEEKAESIWMRLTPVFTDRHVRSAYETASDHDNVRLASESLWDGIALVACPPSLQFSA